MATHQSNLNSCLRSVWLRKQLLALASGTLAFVFWGVGLFLIGMLVDWQTFMPKSGRIIISVIVIGVALYMAWRKGWNTLCAFNARNTALQIEDSLGTQDSLIITAVQFADALDSNGMIDLTCKRAEEKVKQVIPGKVVSVARLKQPLQLLAYLGAVLCVLAVLGIAFFGVGNSATFALTGTVRVLPPWLEWKYPTRTTIAENTGDLVVKEGDETSIKAVIQGVVPENAEIRLRPAIGKEFERSVPIKDGELNYEISSAYLSFEYRIYAGDDRSDWHKVTVIGAPRIKKADVTLTYPDYTRKAVETIDALTMSVPEGTAIKWVLHLDRAVSEASFVSPSGKTRNLAITADGMQVEMEEVATSSQAYSFSWKEKSKGYLFKSPNNYLQVQPDEGPQVEMTKPESNVFATLGRKLEFAYRARDDHGIGEARICYRVGKTEEKSATITPPKPDQQGEINIDWDYREALKNLEVGNSVTFVIEMTDRYPGENGPHRTRSQARRLSILSERDYLKRMYKQKVRLLNQVKNIYREERTVHSLIKEFEPESDSFIQTCQMEVVRQELIRERLLEIKQRIGDLIEDLAANGYTEDMYTAELNFLQGELQRIADNQIKDVSAKLKELSIASTSAQIADITSAVDAANIAARELGVMVLQLGFREATEVMAREIHTISEDQAYLRWRVTTADITREPVRDDLAKRQSELASWLERLLASVPEDRESTEDDAIVAFKLSRLRKELTRASTAPAMRKAADSLGTSSVEETAGMQAEVVKALLNAEFRLRNGLEFSALVKAVELFNEQAEAQKMLREAIAEMTFPEFKSRKEDVKKVQQVLSKRLALLLMPTIPAPRLRLLDAVPAPPPDVEKYLAESVRAQASISSAIEASDRDKALKELTTAEKTFNTLAEIAKNRLDQLAESRRVSAVAAATGANISKIGLFTEQLSGILEKTEDAEADEADASFVIPMLELLAADLGLFKAAVVRTNERINMPAEAVAPLVGYLDNAVLSLKASAAAVKGKKLDEAIEEQEKVEAAFENMVSLLTRQSEDIASLATALSMNRVASEPGPVTKDIQQEQYDMVKLVKATKDEDLPKLATAQKNLIHAVNAVLNYLDPFSHHIETGSVMLFAKEDMDAAAIGLKDKDREEAEDAGSYVAESLQKIINQIDALTPQYTYVMELVEYIHEALSEGFAVQSLQKQLSAVCKSDRKVDIAKMTLAQENLLSRFKTSNGPLVVTTGLSHLSNSSDSMEKALTLLKSGELSEASEEMDLAVDALDASNAELLKLNLLLTLVLAPSDQPVVPPSVSFLVDFTALATHHKRLFRATNLAGAKDLAALMGEQDKLALQCELILKRYDSLGSSYIAKEAGSLESSYSRMRNPAVPLAEAVATQERVLKAFFEGSSARLKSALGSMKLASESLKNGRKNDAVAHQLSAADQFRMFYIATVLKFMTVPGPPPDNPPAPSYDISTEDTFDFGSPGAVSGKIVKGGDMVWNVLGRRDRAALNENFARELPLEYRGILKNYYERLAQ